MAARIPQYQRRVAPEAAAAPRVAQASVDASGLARGLSNLANDFDQIHQREVEEANQTFAISTDSGATEWKNNRLYNPESGAMSQKGENAIGLTERVMADWNDYSKSVIENAKTPAQKMIASRIMSNQGSQIQGQLSPYELQEIKVYKDGVSAGGVITAQNDAALNFNSPGVIDQARLKIEGILDLQGQRNGWSPELLGASKQKAISGMYSDVLRREKANDPYKAQARLKEYQGFLTADDLTQVGSSIDAEVERLRQRAEMQQLRREAKAERTLAQIDAHSATGLPATDEMWARWGKAVQGTPLQAEFNERRRGEVEIQRVMGLPDAQQQAFVNQRMAQLQEKGGTVQELNAVNRLQRTIAGGQKLRAESPIAFAQQQEGLATDVYDPSSDNAADVMADRLSTLQSMRQKYGQTVAIKPLLPQEAAGIAAALDKATPDQQIELLGRLHDTIGDRQGYMGALQQIRPGSPVTAVVGAIAGKQKELTTATHWFKPNDVVTSMDAASVLARGENLINKTKQSNATDGKGKFEMPSEEDFDTALDAYVKDAYADREEAKFIDRQVIRAAYAGLSAERSGGSKTLDSELMDKAVRVGVGEVTDFNGQDTFVPWGMDEDDFRLEARRKLVKAVDDQKLGPPAMVNGLTLKPIGDGRYLVYRGNRKQSATPDGREDLIITIGDGQ
ncbi:hypothetical protein [Pseudomonas juntendi]|uniref:hypothetical protein n=1 Tax=Pseudomonas juntendi TaxID=2666183 RepID=UPI00244D3E5F|nr:hypothetical protein [Pseudomonas juntendi]MDH0042459.1 hypothetical protein [Pseudomonas juntendi]